MVRISPRTFEAAAVWLALALMSAAPARACPPPKAEWDLKQKGLAGFTVRAMPERFAEAGWPAELSAHAPFNSVEVRVPDGRSVLVLRSLRDPGAAYARLPGNVFRTLPQDAPAAAVSSPPGETGAPVELQSLGSTAESGVDALLPVFEMANPGLYRHDILVRDSDGHLISAIEVDECFPHGVRRNETEYDGSRECGITVLSLNRPASATSLGELKNQVKSIVRRERGIHVVRIDQIITDLPKSYADAPEKYYQAFMEQERSPRSYAPWGGRFPAPAKSARHSAIEIRATDRTGAKEPYVGRIDPGTMLVVAVSHGAQANGGAAPKEAGRFCNGFVVPKPGAEALGSR